MTRTHRSHGLQFPYEDWPCEFVIEFRDSQGEAFRDEDGFLSCGFRFGVLHRNFLAIQTLGTHFRRIPYSLTPGGRD